jgi:hypothetical protein
MSQNTLDTGVDPAQEVFTKPDPLPFVPGISFLEIFLSFLREDQPSGHGAPVSSA